MGKLSGKLVPPAERALHGVRRGTLRKCPLGEALRLLRIAGVAYKNFPGRDTASFRGPALLCRCLKERARPRHSHSMRLTSIGWRKCAFCCACRAVPRTYHAVSHLLHVGSHTKVAAAGRSGRRYPCRQSSDRCFVPGRSGIWVPGAKLASIPGRERKLRGENLQCLRLPRLAATTCSECKAGGATDLLVLPASLSLVRGVPNLSLGGNNDRKKVAHSGISFDSGDYRVSGGKFRIGTE